LKQQNHPLLEGCFFAFQNRVVDQKPAWYAGYGTCGHALEASMLVTFLAIRRRQYGRWFNRANDAHHYWCHWSGYETERGYAEPYAFRFQIAFALNVHRARLTYHFLTVARKGDRNRRYLQRLSLRGGSSVEGKT